MISFYFNKKILLFILEVRLGYYKHHHQTKVMKAALLVVDMTVEQVAALSATRKKLIVDSIQQLSTTSSSSCNWTLKIDSRLWLNNNQESTLSSVYPEWGSTMGIPHSKGADILPELKQNSHCELQFVAKKHYSCFVHSELMDILKRAEITHVFITGINTDYCIFNTAMDSFARGKFHTYVVEEAVGSISGMAGHNQALSWIRAHMGPDAVVSLTEAIKMLS